MQTHGHAALVEPVRKLLRRNAERNLVKILRQVHAADIAALLQELEERDVPRLFMLVPDVSERAEILAEAEPSISLTVLESLSDEDVVEIIENMNGDDAADMIELLGDERKARIMGALDEDDATYVDALLGYDPNTAGGIMSPDVFALPRKTRVREAIETLQASHEDLEMAFYLYVVNEHGHLVGVCSLRQLVVSDPDATLDDIMEPEVKSVTTGTDQELVAKLVARYNFLAIPVTDDSNRLLGIVTVDDVIDVIKEEATKDMLMMAGVGADLDTSSTPWMNVRLRMPWLLATFFSGLGSMTIIQSFEDTLMKVAALASFIPITLGMGGNVGTQAAAVVIRGVAVGKVSSRQFVSVISREVATGAILGVIYGVLLGTAVWLIAPEMPPDLAPWRLSATVSIGIGACMVIAVFVGGALPLLFDHLGIDPAIAAGPFVTTSIDILGITIYFLVGSALLL